MRHVPANLRTIPASHLLRAALAALLAALLVPSGAWAAAKKKGRPAAEEPVVDFAGEADPEEDAPGPKGRKGDAGKKPPRPDPDLEAEDDPEAGDDAPPAKRDKKDKVGIGGGAPAANDMPTLVVIGVAAGDQQRVAEQLAAVAEATTRRSERHTLVDLADALDPAGQQAREKRIASAKTFYATGKGAYEVDLDMSMAVEFFTKALKEYEAAGFDRTWTEAAAAWAFRIAAHANAGDQALARTDMEALATVDPRQKLPKAVFPPDILTLVKKVQADVKRRASFTLGVSVKPAAARVYVDGGYAGIAPVEVKNLPGGTHYVSARSPGLGTVHRAVAVKAGAAETIELPAIESAASFLQTRTKIAADIRSDERNGMLRELGGKCAAQQVLFLGLVREGDELHAQIVRLDVADGHVLGFAEETFSALDPKLEEAVDRAVATVLEKDAPRGEGGKAVADSGTGFVWTRKTTGYATMGLGAAIVGTGVIFGLSALGTQDDLKLREQPDPAVPQLVDDTRSKALTSDILYAVGAVGLAVGAYLAFLSRPSTHSVNDDAPAGTTPDEVAPPPTSPSSDEKDPFALRLLPLPLPPARGPGAAALGGVLP